jgi:hypothetical protein
MACGPKVTDVLSKLPLGMIVRARWAQSVGRYALLKLVENKGQMLWARRGPGNARSLQKCPRKPAPEKLVAITGDP